MGSSIEMEKLYQTFKVCLQSRFSEIFRKSICRFESNDNQFVRF